AEARGIAAELGILLSTYTGKSGGLLRLSDPVMLRATEALTRASIPYIGPGAPVMQLCYDKLAATQRVAAAGIACPASDGLSFPPATRTDRRFPGRARARHGIEDCQAARRRLGGASGFHLRPAA